MLEKKNIHKILLPFSFLYGTAVWFRNKLFDLNILSGKEYDIPVLSVGNITAGGTGKTPHVEYLVELFYATHKVAVVSRGYKRKTKGFVLADEKATSLTIGDEPFQIYNKFPDILVAVDGNRNRAIKKLLELPEDKKPEIIILDDAFQHRYVKPYYSFMLTNSNRLIYDDCLLPAGRLRDRSSSRLRANMLIVTKCSEELKPIDYRIIRKNLRLSPWQELFFTGFIYDDLKQGLGKQKKRTLPLATLKEKNYHVVLVAGIANPSDIIEELSEYTTALTPFVFSDHRNFSKSDIRKITEKFKAITQAEKLIVTTEKDYMRLINHKYLPEKIKQYIYYLPVKVNFKLEQEDLFKQKIKEHVKNFKRNSRLA